MADRNLFIAKLKLTNDEYAKFTELRNSLLGDDALCSSSMILTPWRSSTSYSESDDSTERYTVEKLDDGYLITLLGHSAGVTKKNVITELNKVCSSFTFLLCYEDYYNAPVFYNYNFGAVTLDLPEYGMVEYVGKDKFDYTSYTSLTTATSGEYSFNGFQKAIVGLREDY